MSYLENGYYGCKHEVTFFVSIHLLLGYEKIVAILIEHGANVNAANENKETALTFAVLSGNTSQTYIHLKHAQDLILQPNIETNNDLFIDTGWENVTKLLVENGVDLNFVNNKNNTALILAVSEGIHQKI